MAKLGTMTLKGASGRSYEFNVYSADTEFAEIGAVYYVSKREQDTDGNGTHTRIYIGQTDNMKERFDNHHKMDCFKKHGYNSISIHQDGDEKSRLAKESDLISNYNPPCND